MPIDISTEATTRSMIEEGQEQQKADLEGALELGNHEGRDQHAHRQIFRFLRLFLAGHVDEQLQVLFADILLHEGA